ncbi:ATP-dependent helicase [Alienimonas chondri]|uniref:DNA 3'-5' helicase n=1 Tax=Alienimonas chondri TaxID=2681879 RepID=A0ABX1VG42_9PLAN|nr:ATP-dependent helicase [Alienimonas chondri]NNJ26421.1 ATP-dependent DNA helicase PcrA [Alienimonas chondri]
MSRPEEAESEPSDQPSPDEGILAGLNAQQRTAAGHGDGPLLIVAGAGTGKTTTLAARVAHLIQEDADPAGILLLTFTRRAATEMLERVARRLRGAMGDAGERAAREVWGGTFHGVAARVLRVYHAALGLPRDFSILDRGDTEDLLDLCRGRLELPSASGKGAGARFPKKAVCAAVLSRSANSGETVAETLETRYPHLMQHEAALRRLFDLYDEAKGEQNLLDFDDLLLFWEALAADPKAGPALRSRFPRVLVDEYQDTNVLQARLLKNLAPDGRGLTAVGDDAQAIYSFRAATIRNILDFGEHYPAATVLPLETNYRSTAAVLTVANAVIAAAAERHEKTLTATRQIGPKPLVVRCRDEAEQARFIADRVLELRESGLELDKQAALFRASHHSLALELELQKRDVPFKKFGGLRFLETAHVKDLLAFLRLAENPRDEISALRCLLLLPGIGRGRATKAVAALREAGGEFSTWADSPAPSGGASEWTAFVSLMQTLAANRDDLSSQIRRIRNLYRPLMEATYANAAERNRDLEQIELLAGRGRDRASFLADLTLDPPSSAAATAGPHEDEERLTLSTMHSAKGLEFEAVYVLNACQGGIPSDQAEDDAAIEEERRLFYVAVTRARTHLTICHPLTRHLKPRGLRDGYGFAELTPFLTPAALAGCEVMPASEDAVDAAPPTPAATVTAADVRAAIRGRRG